MEKQLQLVKGDDENNFVLNILCYLVASYPFPKV